jgi:hypothetical protein
MSLPTAHAEQELLTLSGFAIDGVGFRWSDGPPGGDECPNERIDRLAERPAGLVRWHVQADRKRFPVLFVASLLAPHAVQFEAADLVDA